MKTIKIIELLDNLGRKISRKVRKDSKGLFIVNKGLKGYLVKSIKTVESESYRVLYVTRKVDYYI